MKITYLMIIQFFLLIGAIGVMCAAIVLFLINKERIQNYAPKGFGGNQLFWSYFLLLSFFLCGYIGYFAIWIFRGMTEIDFLISSILFFGAWFVVLTMLFIRKLFDSILAERKNQNDSLTGLLNKGAVRAIIEDEIKKSNDCVMAIFDLDNFKGINDHFGHMEGDMVIIKVADLIQSSLRSQDIVGRFGGDEFVVLLTDTQMSDGVHIIEQVKEKIAEYYQKKLQRFFLRSQCRHCGEKRAGNRFL